MELWQLDWEILQWILSVRYECSFRRIEKYIKSIPTPIFKAILKEESEYEA